VGSTTPPPHGGTLAAGGAVGHDAPVPADVPVLVVDDQAPFRAAARALVGRMGGFVVVGEAATGEEAVDAARRLAPRLVLMDIKLPGIDGIEATRRVLAAAPATVVVLCSTYQPADLPEGAADCGAAGYVRKEDLSPAGLAALFGAATPPGAAAPG
jgi:DNA-binding NarL/FixJ family response regulator